MPVVAARPDQPLPSSALNRQSSQSHNPHSVSARARHFYTRLKGTAASYARAGAALAENCVTAFAPRRDLVILDDIFPLMLSAFRIAEYNCYLETFSRSIVYSTAGAFQVVGEKKRWAAVVREYEGHYPNLSGRVRRFDKYRRPRARLAYTVFINNAYSFVDYIDKHRIPFVFTLYPGGGFKLEDEVSDRMLRRVFSSPNFRKVVVTQNVTHRYLLDVGFCRSEDIEFVYGVVLPSDLLARKGAPRVRYGEGKETLDICFVAHKYMPRGIDKGYDVFIETARLLCRVRGDVQFHIVGQFDESDVDVRDLRERITFYGPLTTQAFTDFYSRMDIILSPNRSFALKPGAFDGFPTGSCVEAGMSGVAVFCTDDLGQNCALKDGTEIVIIQHDPLAICEVIQRYLADVERLYTLARNGQAAMRRIFDLDAQMGPRLRLLRECLAQWEKGA